MARRSFEMNACRYSKKYTGIRAPRCNNGKGCAKCWEIFFSVGPRADAIPVKNSAKDRFGRDRKKLRDCFKKVYFHDKSRKGTISEARRKRIIGEMGDVMWYFDVLLREFGITLREVL